jgi:hypothetical protein
MLERLNVEHSMAIIALAIHTKDFESYNHQVTLIKTEIECVSARRLSQTLTNIQLSHATKNHETMTALYPCLVEALIEFKRQSLKVQQALLYRRDGSEGSNTCCCVVESSYHIKYYVDDDYYYCLHAD